MGTTPGLKGPGTTTPGPTAAAGDSAGEGPSRMQSVWRVARWAFGLTGLVFLVWAFQRQGNGWSGTFRSLTGRAILSAGLLTSAGLLAGALGWGALFENPAGVRSRGAEFLISQLGKYVPGGIWQLTGQFALSVNARMDPQRVGVLITVYLGVQFIAAVCTSSILALTAPAWPLWLRLTCAAGALSPVLLRRRWIAGLLALPNSARLRRAAELLPDQRAIWRSLLCAVLAILSAGACFSVLVSRPFLNSPAWLTIPAFAAAWAVGLAAVPFPAGIGVREAVLLAVLGPTGAPIIAASVGQRLVQMAVEAILSIAALCARR